MYHNNYYRSYASYYGEAAARVYYGAWSPPEGTPPPAGITVADPSNLPVDPNTQQSSNIPEDSTSGGLSSTSAASSTQIEGNGDVIATDPAEAERQWDEYKKQYAQWYEEHGREAGADPNPPRPQ